MTKGHLRILAYHRILPQVGDQTLAISTTAFVNQITYLKQKKYRFMTLAEYAKVHLQGKAPRKGNIAILTFDDGYADNYMYAYPILKQQGITATFFITTGLIGSAKPYYWDLKNATEFSAADYPMTAEQLCDLQTNGMEIASHTVHHYELSKLTAADMTYELAQSKKDLEEILKQKVTSICYPRGAYSSTVLKVAQDVGYSVGVITPRGKLPYTLLGLSRIGLYGHDTPFTTWLKLSGVYSILRSMRA